MARPKKQEVDYFPHYCEHGKVLFVVESRWGNNGYAFFYKLCEVLGKKEGHAYDCNEPGSWEYLMARALLNESDMTAMLDTLSNLNVIDRELWRTRVIWMQSFVDSVSDVYSRRKVHLPTRPVLMSTEIPLTGPDDNINPQRKVKESKVKDKKKASSPPVKMKFLDSVFLSAIEHQKLKEVIGQKNLEIGIEQLDYSITVKGGKYKDHYKTILNWHKRGFLKGGGNGQGIERGGRDVPEYEPEPMPVISDDERRENLEKIKQFTARIG